MPAVVYNRHYDLGFPGLERLHPFDARKYGRAWHELNQTLGRRLRDHFVPVDRAANEQELLLAHSPEYLAQMRRSSEIAAAVEIPQLSRVPSWLLRRIVLRPMQWAVRGTILAAKAALDSGVAVNLAGGYHHAKRDHGEGFCIYSDIAIAVRQLRAAGLLSPGQRIAYIDLDAHQGNGVCHQFRDDRDVFILDMYNPSIYPDYDIDARERIDCDLPLPVNCGGGEYLEILRTRLPGFLDSVARSGPPPLAIYNAGTDVIQGDPLGDLALTSADVLERDLFVVDQCQTRGLPVVMLTSGGYTRESYQLIAATVAHILERDPTRPGGTP